LQTLLDATPERVDGEPWTRGGRGATWAVAVDERTRGVLRWYRRGGALRHLVRDRYFGWRPRPLRELLVTEQARRQGVPAVEVLAARVDRLAGGCYRGAIVTRAVEQAETLAEVVVRRPPQRERDAVIDAVARAVATMHDRGVHHRDLNAANILVQRDGDRVRVHVIDFDRATMRAALSERRRRQALRRLARSLAKLDPQGALVSAEDRAAFHRAYWGRP
jgi:tRNA A-37 threonylcarbamoyl transferase component Bud32